MDRASAGGRLPNRGSLDQALAGARRVAVSEVVPGRRRRGRLLLEVRDPAEVVELVSLIRIRPADPFHCMCFGDQHVDVYGRVRRRARITLHHGRSIRWDAWDSDALLDEPMPLLRWLADHGVDRPLHDFESAREEELRALEAWDRWKEAAPACLRPIIEQIPSGSFDPFDPGHPDPLAPALETLRGAYGTDVAAVRALLSWYGRGAGPWSGYPSYESVAEQLLLRFPTGAIAAAIEGSPGEHELTGAARYLSSYEFGRWRRGDLGDIPDGLISKLVDHVSHSPHDANRDMLRAVFAGDERGELRGKARVIVIVLAIVLAIGLGLGLGVLGLEPPNL